MTKTEWKKYTGSDEQIEEMWNADGYILRFSNKIDNWIRNAKESWSASFHFYDHCREAKHVTHYLICNPHPLADMICQQARTGQPVYWRSIENGGTGKCHEYFPPFAYPNEVEYRFTPFED